MAYPHYRGKDRDSLSRNWSELTTLDFSRIATRENIFVFNERQFALMIGTSAAIQRSLGWIGIKNNNVFYPDVAAILDNGEVMRCELEYEAGSFAKHKHSGRHCDLIVSFIRRDYQKMIKGIPVWSFYLEKEGVLSWTLSDDIRKNGVFDDLVYGFQKDDISEIDEQSY